MNRFFVGIKILRPLNMTLCLFAVLIAAFLIGGLLSPILPYAVLIVLCFAGASNILNDVIDVHIDKINRPERVLPSNRLKMHDALLIMTFLYGAGIMITTFVQPLGQKIALIAVLPILVLYTPIFKRMPFIGNVVVGGVLGLVFVFTEGALLGTVDKMWIPFFLATALSTIRELIKDAEDMQGDSAENIQTFPRKFGLLSTLWLLRLLSAGLCFYAIIPFASGKYGIAYLLTLILGVEIPLLYGVFILLKEKSRSSDYSRASKILKGVIMIGMVVILLSEF